MTQLLLQETRKGCMAGNGGGAGDMLAWLLSSADSHSDGFLARLPLLATCFQHPLCLGTMLLLFIWPDPFVSPTFTPGSPTSWVPSGPSGPTPCTSAHVPICTILKNPCAPNPLMFNSLVSCSFTALCRQPLMGRHPLVLRHPCPCTPLRTLSLYLCFTAETAF